MKLRQVREDRCIGLNQLARKVGISPPYLSELERGIQQNPSKKLMDKLAEALESSVSELFYEKGGEEIHGVPGRSEMAHENPARPDA